MANSYYIIDVIEASTKTKTRKMAIATTEHNAVNEIILQGFIPVNVEKYETNLFNREFVTKDYKRNFLQSLYFNIEAGMSSAKALSLVIQSEVKPAMQKILLPALITLEQGGIFSEAIKAIDFFDSATIAILISGEKTGQLKLSVESALDHYERTNNSLKIITGILSFMSIELFMTVSTFVYLHFWFIPKLKEDGIKTDNPEELAAFFSNIEIGYWLNLIFLFIGVGLIGVAVALFAYVMLPLPEQTKKTLESYLYRLPVFTSFFQNVALSDSFGVAAVMLKGGVALMPASEIAKSTSSFNFIRDYWKTIQEYIMSGMSTAEALNRKPLNDSEKIMIASHTSSAQLAVVLAKISQMRFEQSKMNAGLLKIVIMYGSLAYGAIGVLIYLWLLWLQNGSIMAMLTNGG